MGQKGQPKDLSECKIILILSKYISTYGQQLAQQVLMEFIIDPIEGVESISAIPIQLFLRKIFKKKKYLTIDKAKIN